MADKSQPDAAQGEQAGTAARGRTERRRTARSRKAAGQSAADPGAGILYRGETAWGVGLEWEILPPRGRVARVTGTTHQVIQEVTHPRHVRIHGVGNFRHQPVRKMAAAALCLLGGGPVSTWLSIMFEPDDFQERLWVLSVRDNQIEIDSLMHPDKALEIMHAWRQTSSIAPIYVSDALAELPEIEELTPEKNAWIESLLFSDPDSTLSLRPTVRLEGQGAGLAVMVLAAIVVLFAGAGGVLWYTGLLADLLGRTQQVERPRARVRPPPSPWSYKVPALEYMNACRDYLTSLPIDVPGWRAAEFRCQGDAVELLYARDGGLLEEAEIVLSGQLPGAANSSLSFDQRGQMAVVRQLDVLPVRAVTEHAARPFLARSLTMQRIMDNHELLQDNLSLRAESGNVLQVTAKTGLSPVTWYGIYGTDGMTVRNLSYDVNDLQWSIEADVYVLP